MNYPNINWNFVAKCFKVDGMSDPNYIPDNQIFIRSGSSITIDKSDLRPTSTNGLTLPISSRLPQFMIYLSDSSPLVPVEVRLVFLNFQHIRGTVFWQLTKL